MSNITIRVVQMNPVVGDVQGNAAKIQAAIKDAGQADLVVLPELALCGYPPEDLVKNSDFLRQIEGALSQICAVTQSMSGTTILGAPERDGEQVYNSAYILQGGRVVDIYRKSCLPNYGVFDEVRVFAAGTGRAVNVTVNAVKFGIAICEDVWFDGVPRALKTSGSDAIISLNASPWRENVISERQTAFAAWADVELPHLFVNQVGGQDELVFDGAAFLRNGNDEGPVYIGKQFSQSSDVELTFNKTQGFRPSTPTEPLMTFSEEMYSALVLGLRDYVNKNGFGGVLLGLSGGIDSAICAAIAVDALGAARVNTVMMPYTYTSGESITDAVGCATALGVAHKTIPIAEVKGTLDATLSLQRLIGDWAVADENIQSRLRGLILMALSNATGDMVITTGNKSEMAVGYATLYGDMCGGYNPIKDVWKTEVFKLSTWRNAHKPRIGLGPSGRVIPQNIIDKPPSAELRPDQRDSDSLPDYDILDDILKRIVEQGQALDTIVAAGHAEDLVFRVNRLLRRSEFKRRQSAPGPKVTSVGFGKDWRYPITNKFLRY